MAGQVDEHDGNGGERGANRWTARKAASKLHTFAPL
jgi:hypothetical protein